MLYKEIYLARLEKIEIQTDVVEGGKVKLHFKDKIIKILIWGGNLK